MHVQDVMTKTVVSCRPDSNLAEATAIMWNNDCGLLPVVGDTGKLMGVVTDRDICIAVGTRNRLACEITVGELMYRPALTCKVDDDIHVALDTMCREQIRRLPIVNNEGSLVGILSMDDVTLQARHQDDTYHPPISYEDVVNTLRAIYLPGSQSSCESAPQETAVAAKGAVPSVA